MARMRWLADERRRHEQSGQAVPRSLIRGRTPLLLHKPNFCNQSLVLHQFTIFLSVRSSARSSANREFSKSCPTKAKLCSSREFVRQPRWSADHDDPTAANTCHSRVFKLLSLPSSNSPADIGFLIKTFSNHGTSSAFEPSPSGAPAPARANAAIRMVCRPCHPSAVGRPLRPVVPDLPCHLEMGKLLLPYRLRRCCCHVRNCRL